MGRRWYDDLTGDDLADDNVHALVVTLDGDPLAAWDVGLRPGRELLDDLAGHLAAERRARDIGIDPDLDPGPLDESAEDPPSVDHDEPSLQASEPDPVDESAEDRPTAARPVESPRVTTVPTGEAERGKATDAQIRRWAIEHGLPCSTTGALKTWLRPEYERLDGGPPDFQARRRARENGAEPTTPSVRPDVAGEPTIATWCLRNGVEDRGGRASVLGRQAYAEAWRAAHPEEKPPAAGVSRAGQDPPTPARAGQPGRASGRSNGTRVPDFPSDSSTDDGTHYAGDGCDPPHAEPGAQPATPDSVRPAIEPVGDGTGQPASTAAQLERADELAADGKTPRQISSETGVWLSEARAAVRKATQR